MPKINKKSFVVLPINVLDVFEVIDFTKIEKNYALKFIKVLMAKSKKETNLIDSFSQIPKNYFRKSFNSQYLIWLKKLINSNLIISNQSYSNLYNYSISYKLNININQPPGMWLTFDLNGYKSIPYTHKEDIYNNVDEKEVSSWSVSDFKKLNIKKQDLINIVKQEVDKINIYNYKVNEQIEEQLLNIKFNFENYAKTYWMTKDCAIIKARSMGCDVIKDDEQFYITRSETYLQRKKTMISQSYLQSVENIDKGVFYGKRNSTNNRLDNNLTNMAKILCEKILKDNNLIQLDLCNAQFAVLSHKLEDKLVTEDFHNFKKQSYNGTLYEHIMEKLNIDKRKDAKTMMFEMMFSKEDNQTHLKAKLKELFPSVVKTVDNYKKENGYAEFSIMLQKEESKLFIDGLWKTFKRNGFFCIPKHDALIFKKEDEQKAIEIIKEYFDKIDFKGKIVKEIFA